MKTIREALGFNLRLARGKRTQAEMAEFLDIPAVSYQRLDAGKTLPLPDTLAQIAEKLGVPEVSLVQLPGEAPPLSPAQARDLLIGKLIGLLPSIDDDKLRALLGHATAYARAGSLDAAQDLPDQKRKLK